jgi:hypothetical protein
MRNIYETGKIITLGLLTVGSLLVAVAIILAVTAAAGTTVIATCFVSGIGLMISSFVLTLLVYLGEDVANIAERITQTDSDPEPTKTQNEPLSHMRTDTGDDPKLMDFIKKIEGNTQNKA